MLKPLGVAMRAGGLIAQHLLGGELRMRSPRLVAALDPSQGGGGPRRHPRPVPGAHPPACRQGSQPRQATIIIANDRAMTPKAIIERYAHRMNIEQRLAESIRSFHIDALSSAVPLNVDLDIALAVVASAVCTSLSLRRRLAGYATTV